MLMGVKWRTIQPPHPSENITLEEAMEAWRRVEGKTGKPGSRRKAARDPQEKPATSSGDDS
jgi:hypothetical protein